MNEEGAPLDSGFDDAGPFSDTPEGDGVPLDAALREFGPAAFEDLVPRLRALAADLDAAHDAGFIHGRLHPSKVFVTGDATYLIGARVRQSIEPSTSLGADDKSRWPVLPPYTAPEVVDGAAPAPAADQFALAAIAYEWMFGRPLSGPAARPLDVRAVPNVDRAALSKAFSRALAPEPFRRFASCTDFVDAVAASLVPSLPFVGADDKEDPVDPFIPEASAAPHAAIAPDQLFTSEKASVTAAEPDLDAINPVLHTPAVDPEREWPAESAEPIAAESAEPIAATRSVRERFSGLALILATLVGAMFGFAAGYMARPRALQSGPPPEIAAPRPDNELKPAAPVPAPGASASASEKAPTSAAKAPKAPAAPTRIGRLLVRSTPSGASVEVDGVARGVTPLALQELDLGAREITVSRQGYVSEERRIVLTKARPSRSVEVRLSPPDPPKRAPSDARESGPRPATPASLGKPAAVAGALVVESRPNGAAVTVNGKPSGTTPVTISDLPPGEYRVTIALQGYRPFTTTVRVVAGGRARAAARLTEQEQQ